MQPVRFGPEKLIFTFTIKTICSLNKFVAIFFYFTILIIITVTNYVSNKNLI